MPKILFISHDATRTGAPILLLNLAALLKERAGYEIDFIVKRGGPLVNKFEALGHTYRVVNPNKLLRNKILRDIYYTVAFRLLKSKIKDYDFVLSNTITNGDLDKVIGEATVYTYVHELPFTIKTVTTETQLKNVLRHTKLFLVPSQAVKKHLHTDQQIDLQKIQDLPYYIIDHFAKKREAREKVRAHLNIKENDFVVGGMGFLGWRKGNDVFLHVARMAVKENPAFKFVWCGGEPDRKEFTAMQLDIKNMGLESAVTLLPSTEHPWEIMASFDAFFLSSREDPYPLVVLEAAMMGLPVVCFDKSGGATEFVETDCGYIIDYLDIEKAGRALLSFSNPDIYSRFANAAREKYLNRHSAENVLQSFRNIING